MSETTTAADLDPRYAAIREQHRERDRLEAQIRPLNLRALFGALAEGGVTALEVVFDGCADSGQIESVTARAGEVETALPAVQVTASRLSYATSQVEVVETPLFELIETLAYDLLRDTHAGWGNDEGAYGEFVFDVAARTVSLDYNERFLDIQSFSHSW